ncbi:MAG TPA: hypothetical protein V6D22_21980 [Candidatus Obscuribacterales bacterium]
MKGVVQLRGSSALHPVTDKLRAPAALIVLVTSLLAPPSLRAQEHAEDMRPPSFMVLNNLTGWTHDAAGYHPAVFMVLENTSGQDLSTTNIKLQARFTDLQTAEVSLGRRDLRHDLKPHQQISVSITDSQPFELPFEVQLWPTIEAKVMCRVGNVGDDGTETLLVSKIDPTTHTEEEAFQSLNAATSYAPRGHQSKPSPPLRPKRPEQPPEQKPLVATAGRLGDASRPAPTNGGAHPGAQESSAIALLNSRSLPGLGDDFYQFEQKFGLPQEVDAKHSDWTWARYRHASTGVQIIGGAHEGRGKVDVLIVTVPRSPGLDEFALSNTARNLSGRLHAETLSGAGKSVRYLPSGRVELVTRNAPGYKVLCLSGSDPADNSLILVLSRGTQDVERLLASQSQKVNLLKFWILK